MEVIAYGAAFLLNYQSPALRRAAPAWISEPKPFASRHRDANQTQRTRKREGKKARVVVEYIHTRDCLPGVDVRRASRFDDYTVYPKLRPYGSEGKVREQEERKHAGTMQVQEAKVQV